jgi:hypothetical protein
MSPNLKTFLKSLCLENLILTIMKPKLWSLDSNEFLSKSLWDYIPETFLATITFKKTSKESIFEVISLHGPLGLHLYYSQRLLMILSNL